MAKYTSGGEENNHNNWLEYRALVLSSINDLKIDLKNVERRLSSLEKYSDIHEDFKKLKADFETFLLHYEKDFNTQSNRISPIEIRQRWMIAVYGTIGGIIASYLFRFFMTSQGF